MYIYEKKTESAQQFLYLVVTPTEKISRDYWRRGPPYTPESYSRFSYSRYKGKRVELYLSHIEELRRLSKWRALLGWLKCFIGDMPMLLFHVIGHITENTSMQIYSDVEMIWINPERNWIFHIK